MDCTQAVSARVVPINGRTGLALRQKEAVFEALCRFPAEIDFGEHS